MNHTTPEGQKQMLRNAEIRTFNVCKTFMEIQSGPNPLTREEVRKLIQKRPDLYAILENNA